MAKAPKSDDEEPVVDPFEEAPPADPGPVARGVDPVPAQTIEGLDIGPTDPYPTGDPQGPVTYAEINGLVPTGTGPLQPIPPDPLP